MEFGQNIAGYHALKSSGMTAKRPVVKPAFLENLEINRATVLP